MLLLSACFELHKQLHKMHKPGKGCGMLLKVYITAK
jgi:hypothetical protein